MLGGGGTVLRIGTTIVSGAKSHDGWHTDDRWHKAKQYDWFYSPDRPNVDDVLTLNANAIDNVGGPLDSGSVVVQAISPSGKTQTIRLQPGTEDLAGLFVGAFVPKEPGNYRLVAK